jgi:hypothetical protein
MKFTLFVGVALLTLVACAGCNVMMYPFALMFGGPTESTLKEVRRDFSDLKKSYQTATHVFMPTYLISGETKRWDSASARSLRDHFATLCDMTARCDTTPPDVPFGNLGMNQYRFLWNQAEEYADWVERSHIQADYVWCSEMFMNDSLGAYAIQVYVLTSDGRIAYLRQLNSHWFKNGPPKTSDDCARTILDVFMEAMKHTPEQQFPPYGVG